MGRKPKLSEEVKINFYHYIGCMIAKLGADFFYWLRAFRASKANRISRFSPS